MRQLVRRLLALHGSYSLRNLRRLAPFYTDEQLQAARDFQRKAQWRPDFIAAENSLGFHADQEAARILGEAIDYARQGQLAVAGLR